MCAAPWTAARIELLRRLWAGGATAQAIAERLGGASRAAVLGKVFRLRLAAGSAPAGAESAAPLVRRRRRKRPVADAKLVRQPRPRAPKPSVPRPPRCLAPEPSVPRPPQRSGKNLLQLTNHSCRWPHGEPGTPEFYFCSAPGADLQRGMPYCARHSRLACNANAAIIESNKPPAPASAPPARRRTSRQSKRRAYVIPPDDGDKRSDGCSSTARIKAPHQRRRGRRTLA